MRWKACAFDFVISMIVCFTGLYAFKWPLKPQDRPHHIDDIIHGLLAGRYRKHNF